MKKGKMIRVENDIVTIGMNNGSIKEVRRCDLGFDPVLGDLVEIFEDEDQIIVTKAKKEPENHNDAGININMTNSINNASDVAAGNGKKVVNKVAYCLLALFLGGFGAHKFYSGKTGMGILYHCVLLDSDSKFCCMGRIDHCCIYQKSRCKRKHCYVTSSPIYRGGSFPNLGRFGSRSIAPMC